MTTRPQDVWIKELQCLKDAYKPQPPLTYIVDGLFPIPSLNIVYGAPGCMKSLLLADLVLCVATGRTWLNPMPHAVNTIVPIKTTQCPVLWLDFDNGERRTTNRFAAFGTTYKAPPTTPVHYLAIPSVPFDATKKGDIDGMMDIIMSLGARFVVIDNLLTVSGGKDENSPEIAAAMSNLRLICERTGSAVVVIHHSRKDSGFKGSIGDDLRGHSSIRGSIDLALQVKREEGSDIVNIKSTKTRDVDVDDFGAIWTYTHKAGTKELETAAFYGQKVAGVESTVDIENAIKEVLLLAGKPLNQSELWKAVKAGNIQAGRDRIRTVIERMVNTTRLRTSTGARGAVMYAPF